MWKVPKWVLIVVPALIFVVGASMNKLAQVTNGNQMPVLWPGGCEDYYSGNHDDLDHRCMTTKSHLKWMSDWLNWQSEVGSIGDLLIDAARVIYKPCWWGWFALILNDRGWFR